jgi:hypothetical protein
LPRHCLRCHGYRQLARDCKWPRSAKSAMKGGNLPWHSARAYPPASQAPHGGPPSSDGAALGAMGVPTAPSDDANADTDAARVSRRGTPAGARLPTMPLLLLLY